MTRLSVSVVGWSRGARGRHLFLIDLVAIAVSIYLSLALRFDGLLGTDQVLLYLPIALLPLIVRPITNERFGLYRRAWGHASVPELTLILWSSVVGTVVCLILFVTIAIPSGMPGSAGFPRSFWAIELVMSLALIGGSRFLIRALNDLGTTTRVDGEFVSFTPTLLYGAGRAGALMARSARRDARAGMRPAGFLDDDTSLHGATVAGLPVFGGLDQLGRAVRRTGAGMLLITMPNAAGPVVRRVMDAGLEAGLEVRTVPAIHEVLDGSWDASRLRQVRVEDLLTREQVTIHAPGVAETIRDQVVMVTGAGGSIGSELARQVFAFHPRQLILVDRAESPLYLIQRELELRRSDGRGSGELSIHLANVASRSVMYRLVGKTRPSVIFHAAACKHVPMMEEHPSEGVQVNIGGTLTVLAAAEQAGVPRFVLVSTDKAVEPSSVMGATKRIAEWLVADAAARTGRAYVAVRFGNVLGSAGSVLPILQHQLEQGEALTVTHPDMTRYFMTIQEAGWLILDAGAIGRPGDLFVLDMGEPVRIMDMVEDLVRLSGRPAGSVPIRMIGLRPGEKLHEQLFYSTETVEPTSVAKILRVKDAARPPAILDRVRPLLELAFGEQEDRLRAELLEAVWFGGDVSGWRRTQGDAPPAAATGTPGAVPSLR